MNCGILGNGPGDSSLIEPNEFDYSNRMRRSLDWAFQRGVNKTGSDALSSLHKVSLVKNAPTQLGLFPELKFPKPTWHPASL